jgi:hypothetical protein
MAERTPSITSPSLSEGVDISPISTTDRRNSLEKHLQTRPDEQDLKNRHILLDTNTAPALQARQLELERQRATDNLKKGLGKRPEREELIERKWYLSLLHRSSRPLSCCCCPMEDVLILLIRDTCLAHVTGFYVIHLSAPRSRKNVKNSVPYALPLSGQYEVSFWRARRDGPHSIHNATSALRDIISLDYVAPLRPFC